jgi:phosphoglycerol transferase MdoB-like AlkP superfamily enzyme
VSSAGSEVVILAIRNATVSDVYAFALEECFPGLRVLACEDRAQLESALEKNSGACVVVGAAIEEEFSGFFLDRAALAPSSQFFVLAPAAAGLEDSQIPTNVTYLGGRASAADLAEKIEAALRLSTTPRYVKITTERLLARGDILRSDLFLKIAAGNYVRVARAGELFGKAELKSIRAQEKAPYFYLLRKDYLDTIEDLLSNTSLAVRLVRRIGRLPLIRSEGLRTREDLLIRRAFEDLALLSLTAVAILFILQFSLNRPMDLPFLSLGPGPFIMNVWLILAVILPWSILLDARALSVLALGATAAFARFNLRKILELGKPISLLDFQHLYMSRVLIQYVGVREAIALLILLCVPFLLRYAISGLWRGGRTWTVSFFYFVGLSLVFMGFFGFVCFEPFRPGSFLLKRFPPYYDEVEFAFNDGYPLATLLGLQSLRVHKAGFAGNMALDVLRDEPIPAPPPGGKARSVVVVLMESFRDYSLDGILFHEDVLPFYHRLKLASKVGKFYSPTVGGGTANVEFEVLAGIPTAFMPQGSIVYERYIDRFVPTLVSLFKQNGYATYAIHNKSGGNYLRTKVFSLLGFDHFFDEKQLVSELGPMPGERYPDRAVFAKSLKLFANRMAKRQFQYLVTYETHGPYDENTPKKHWVSDATLLGDTSLVQRLDTYSDRMNKLDGDLAWYFSELGKLKDPPIVVLFGDHHPSMSFDLPFGARSGDHRVEGVLALGKKAGAKLYEGEKPIFCLSPLVAAEAGVPATSYFQFVDRFCRSHQFEGPLKITTGNEKEFEGFRAIGFERLFGDKWTAEPTQ